MRQRVLELARARGTLAAVEIANMHQQTLARERRLLETVPDRCAAIAVAGGDGNRRLFESLGARVVDGGRTMNPSTAELLAALEAEGAEEAVVLPNDRNVHLAAEHAAEHATKPVRVVPTVSLQAGLAAMVAFDAAASAEANAEAMAAGAADVATGAVTVASRDLRTNGLAIRKGAWLGLAEGTPVAGGGTFEEVTRAVVERLLAEPRSVLTLLTGEQPPALCLLYTSDAADEL